MPPEEGGGDVVEMTAGDAGLGVEGGREQLAPGEGLAQERIHGDGRGHRRRRAPALAGGERQFLADAQHDAL